MPIVEVPGIPDPVRLGAVRELCETATPYAAGAECDLLFVRAMIESCQWHQVRSAFYSRLLDDAGIRPEELKTVADCARLPFVPAAFFKKHELLSVPREAISLTLTSSGTQGQKSQMFFDDWSIRAPQRMVEFIFNHYAWNTPDETVNTLLYTYEVEPDSKLGTAYTDNFLCGFARNADVFAALRRTGTGSHEFDVFGVIAKLREYEKTGLPVRIFGFPAFLYFTIKRMKDLGLPALRLSPRSLVFLGGGWKGHADQAIRPEELYASVVEMLGIPDGRIRDGFGSVEHCIPYVECARHHFHVPIWSRVVVRDVATLEPAPLGTAGFLSFISPYITSAPANHVLMGDLAELHSPEDCGCGLPTSWFRVLGRAGSSRNKSCAIAAAELLKGMK